MRVYAPGEAGPDGYPLAWHESIKHHVREQAGHRCVRCGHPYECGVSPGEWSPCDERCEHGGPVRWREDGGDWLGPGDPFESAAVGVEMWDHVEARWRVLTVHHLDYDKLNCRWFNLAALCQRCHLTIQGKVVMDRRWAHEHSAWFRPYVAGYYASVYLGEELSRGEAVARQDELLALEHRQLDLASAVSGGAGR